MAKTCRTCYHSCPFEDCSEMKDGWKDYDLKKCTCERTMRTKDLDAKHYCKYWIEDTNTYQKFRLPVVK